MGEPHEHDQAPQSTTWHLQMTAREVAERLATLEMRMQHLEDWQIRQNGTLQTIEQSTQTTQDLVRGLYSGSVKTVLGVLVAVLLVMLGLLINHILTNPTMVKP